MTLSDATLRYGEGFCEALLGLDALYAAEQTAGGAGPADDLERLVVLNMSTTHQPEPFADYAAAIARFTELGAAATALPERDRQRYYAQASGSAVAFATWRSTGLPFPDQIGRFLHIPSALASDAELDAIRGEMRTALTDMGYSGDLVRQMADWEARQRVPADEVQGTLDELMSEAWDRTAEVMQIPSDKSDGMKVRTVSGAPFNARCDFTNRTVDLNIDPVLTMPGLRHLAVHEGYPGHYVQFTRRRVAYENGTGPADNLLSVVNTASSTPFEGIADVGMRVIGWDRSPDDHLSGLLSRYRSGIGTRAAWRLHAEGWAPSAVRDEIHRDALTGGEGWVDGRMRFISRPDRAALIWSYWQGEPAVGAAWDQVKDRQDAWPDYFTFLYDRMHSAETVGMFAG
ncbi:MAG TPA: hypothetical protein VGT61_01995 [Thermomicrobiales bacterium]|nr:hypothetical protein [Thermomicrobiales bacterium]